MTTSKLRAAARRACHPTADVAVELFDVAVGLFDVGKGFARGRMDQRLCALESRRLRFPVFFVVRGNGKK